MAIDVGQFMEVRIVGQAQGQAIINTLVYECVDKVMPDPGAAGIPLSTVAVEFRDRCWRDDVLPCLDDEYSVLEYRIQRIDETLQLTGPPEDPLSVASLVGLEQHTLAGTSEDVGQVEDEESLPTLAAASLRKVSAGKRPDTGQLRFFRGGMRLGPIPKSFSDATLGPNRWADAAMALFTSAAESIRVITAIDPGVEGSFEFHLVIPSMYSDGSPNPDALLQTQLVSAVIPSPFISSQVSRKERFILG